MEFRCRLVTAAGEIVEGTYAAENEARLRHDFEAQGLHVLSLRKRSVLSGSATFLQRRKISRHEFLVFNQEFATLLKAGMPLVQSIHLLRQQVANPLFRGRARRRAREGAGRHGVVRGVQRARRLCSRVSTRRRCWPASAAATSTPFCGATSRTRRSSIRFGGRRSPRSSIRSSSSRSRSCSSASSS